MKTDPKHATTLRLRLDWSELDMFGHINNVSFFKYIQSSRVHFWEAIDLPNYMQAHQIGPLLASCTCNFKRPLQYPGRICLVAELAFIGNTSFGLHHTLTDEQGEVAATAEDVMVMVDFKTQQKTPFPEVLKQAIARLAEQGSPSSQAS